MAEDEMDLELGDEEDEAVSPLESDDVDRFDILTAGYRSRLATAMNTLRTRSYYSGFWTFPAAPPSDPDPPADDDETPANNSNKVDYYDGLTKEHRDDRDDAMDDYETALGAYIQYYNAHHETPYVRPTSQVAEIDVTDDGSESALDTNLVDAYDATIGSNLDISSGSSTTAGTRAAYFASKLSSAVARLDALRSGNGSIPVIFSGLTSALHAKWDRNQSGVSPRSSMSALEAAMSDLDSVGSSWTSAANTVKNTTVPNFAAGISDALDDMVTNIANGIKTIRQYNAERAKAYHAQGRTDQWIADTMHLTVAEVRALINS